MRFIVIAFAALACLKVWTQDKLYRSAMSDALIEAYRERAQQVCSRESAKHGAAGSGLWASAAEITVGSKVASVMLWDYDNPLWGVRYRHPHLVLTSGGARKLTCSYDLMVGVAFVKAL
ncbi:MAG: hypothetical protein Q8M03_01835 [Legionella sp.]|nr:hypothetical protein [Legionella sp.]